VFIDDVREQILAIDVAQEAERHGFDRLANIGKCSSGVAAKRFLNQGLGELDSASAATHRRIGFGKLLDRPLLFFGRKRSGAGNFDRHLLDLLGVELGH